MRKKQCCKMRLTAIIVTGVLFFCSVRTFAIEEVQLPVEMVGDDIVVLEIPTIVEGETSIFNFYLDPQQLLYRTNAARFGGGTVEEGATMLFHNREGRYDFSRYSDQLTVTNRSTVPVCLTLSVRITDLGEVQMVGSNDFTDSQACSMYMAVVDSRGNVLPISAEGEISISLEIQAAPENAYVYRLNEDLQTYQLVLSGDQDEIDFDKYSFGLVGACNPNADWWNVSVHPAVSVTWQVKPLIAENTVSGNSSD